jgi:Co/Zn/Cd efflux system component
MQLLADGAHTQSHVQTTTGSAAEKEENLNMLSAFTHVIIDTLRSLVRALPLTHHHVVARTSDV